MKNLFYIAFVLMLSSCNSDDGNKNLKIATYRAVIDVQNNEKLPFIFDVTSPQTLKIFNAEEVIDVDEVVYDNDSVYINLPVFKDYLVAKITEKGNLNGFYISPDRKHKAKFTAKVNEDERFIVESKPIKDVSGNWETVFSQGIPDDQYIAKGIFKQEDQIVTGTFRTTTGDYRYLEGVMDGNIMKLSTFDGAHAFLFTAKVTDSTMEGTFYSGNHFKEPFVAKRNANYELPGSNDLTVLKEGYDSLDFSFPDASGKMISLKDERFKDKVVVVQIMGTWCPNCLDESKYYADFYRKNKNNAIEFIALAFEYAKSESLAFKRIERLKSKIGIEYPVLLAQYGSSDKEKAQEKLPMLKQILSYPTSIFIDKKGKVRKIHTGFNGPATGEKYIEFKAEFERFIEELLIE